METLRRQFGIAEPVRRGMELKIAQAGEWKPAVLGLGPAGKGGVHGDILAGRDWECEWEDVFTGMVPPSFFFFLDFVGCVFLGEEMI
jgi:proteasome maturation protein